MLDAAGWKRGSDGVRQKGKVKLAFTVGTTSGNQARILSEQIMQQQLEKIGVKLTIQNAPDILDVNMTGFDYETLIFAWVGGPDPYTGNVIWLSSAIPAQCSKRVAKAYECDYSGQNYTKVKDPQVDSNFSTPPTRKPIPRCGRSCTTRPMHSSRPTTSR